MNSEGNLEKAPDLGRYSKKGYRDLRMGDVVLLEDLSEIAPEYSGLSARVVYIRGGHEHEEITVGFEILNGPHKGRTVEFWKPEWTMVST